MNTTALVDVYDGAVVERYMYDPYGKPTVLHGVRDVDGTDTSEDEWDPRDAADSFQNRILYSGYHLDTETGLYSVRHRYYHPTLGRWLSRDQIGYSPTFYEYVKASPVFLVDPFGLEGVLPRLEVAETLKLDYSQDGLSREMITPKVRAAVEAQLADYKNKKIYVPKSLVDEGTMGASNFAYGWDFDASVVIEESGGQQKCYCSFRGTKWKGISFAIVIKNRPHDMFINSQRVGKAYSYVEPSNRRQSVRIESTMEHELWHTDGVPKDVFKRIWNWGQQFRFGDKLEGRTIGFSGQAKAQVAAAYMEFYKLVHEERDALTATTDWCSKKGKEIMEKYLIGEAAINDIEKAGYYHLPVQKDHMEHFFDTVPRPDTGGS